MFFKTHDLRTARRETSTRIWNSMLTFRKWVRNSWRLRGHVKLKDLEIIRRLLFF